MGYQIESYTREELRKIAIPGKAVSTLFWALPVGKWHPHELEEWWFHFTETDSLCNKFGLLLARQVGQRNRDEKSTADLAQGLANASGGNLLDLIPEAKVHLGHHNDPRGMPKSLLILCGSYPQPGWGVLLPIPKGIAEPREFEELLQVVVTAACPQEQLQAIRQAAEAYHQQKSLNERRPPRPRPLEDASDVREAAEVLRLLLTSIESGTAPEIDGACTKVRRMLGKLHDASADDHADFWADLSGRVKLLKDLSTAWKSDPGDIVDLGDRMEKCDAEGIATLKATLDPRRTSILKKILFLRKDWPNLDLSRLGDFLESDFRQDLLHRTEENLAQTKGQVLARLTAIQVSETEAQDRYEADLASWKKRTKAAEADYRGILPEASRSQWDLGPPFLMELERECRRRSIDAASIPWDPARMTGWKIHASRLQIHTQDLLVAANTVLDDDVSHLATTHAVEEVDGSLFADYAYFVSITAKRVSPWDATRSLIAQLLSPSQLRSLIEDGKPTDLFTTKTKDQLCGDLLETWGWKKEYADVPRPLAGCLRTGAGNAPVLGTTLNDTRISLENFLKDLVRIAFASLGWQDSEIDEKLALHCPGFRRTPRTPWNVELKELTSGAAIALLPPLWSIWQPSGEQEGKSFCLDCGNLLKALNKGSHDPPPPPPTQQELLNYGSTVRSIIERAEKLIGEMPWHLTPAQSFGRDPMVVTGHAWSHSHPEERLIRLVLWAGDSSDRELLVWNKSRTNPVITDGILL